MTKRSGVKHLRLFRLRRIRWLIDADQWNYSVFVVTNDGPHARPIEGDELTAYINDYRQPDRT